MSIVIMRRHQKRQLHKDQATNVKYDGLIVLLSFFFCRQMIKASILLTIVMGIGWLANVLFFSDKLLLIAYIMTVFISGQGIIIFILYVPLSTPVSLSIITSGYKCHTHTHIQVRKAYSKWWYDKKRKSQLFNKIYFTNPTSLQTSVSYNNDIIMTSYFLTE